MEIQALQDSLQELKKKLEQMKDMLRIEKKRADIVVLEKEVSVPDLWDNSEEATKKTKKLSDLQSEVGEWDAFFGETMDLLEMTELDAADDGVDMSTDIEAQYALLKKKIEKLELLTLLDGKHDKRNAIVSLHAGAGGTEAQDWAEMLQRMLFRYAEKNNWKVTMLDESAGSEAGIKSSTFRVEGRYAYGYLKSEHGTHRLVRISPFDAEGMRHTSFASIEVIPEIDHESDVDIDEKDLRIDTFMSGGKGGQSVNTTYSAVRIVHIPTGITVQCQNERSQLQNKQSAMKVLQSKLQLLKEEKEEAERLTLRGEHKSAEWGNQIRSYVLHPYKMIKDVRTTYETADPDAVLNGNLDECIEAYLRWRKK